jgi:prepilin signal peptidase PulO-like enzyme (type II secretory pathway)
LHARLTSRAVSLAITMLVAACVGLIVLSPVDGAFAVVLAGLTWWLAVSDLARFELPDFANLLVAAVGLIWIITQPEPAQGTIEAVLRALTAGSFLAAVKLTYARVRSVEGLGWGDVKLMAAGGIWLNWPELPVALLMAALAALCAIAARINLVHALQSSAAVPLGAFLAPSIWIVWVMARAGVL